MQQHAFCLALPTLDDLPTDSWVEVLTLLFFLTAFFFPGIFFEGAAHYRVCILALVVWVPADASQMMLTDLCVCHFFSCRGGLDGCGTGNIGATQATF